MLFLPLAFGLTPAPANLLAAGRDWPARNIFWVVKHGVKMSGMPAWEFHLRDDELWTLVAFMQHGSLTADEHAVVFQQARQPPLQRVNGVFR